MVINVWLRTASLPSYASALVALAAAVPLLIPAVWSGVRIAQSDEVLSVIAASEQPLSVRSVVGVWAVLLALVWFGLGYWRRSLTLWEAAIVVIGGSLALARLGNTWLYGLVMIVPLARQLSMLRPRAPVVGALIAISLTASASTFAASRPPMLPTGAENTALTANGRVVFADWQWAPVLQQAMGDDGHVLGAGGFTSETREFWVDYLRVTQGHERWANALRDMGVGVVVLDVAQSRPAVDLVRQSSDWHVTYDTDGVVVAERFTR